MRGSIVKRGRRFSVVVEKWHSGFERRRDAERALAEILGRLESGNYIEPARLSFGAYLTEPGCPRSAPVCGRRR